MAKNNPGNIVRIFYTDPDIDKLVMKNNILYKEYSSGTLYKQAIWFDGIEEEGITDFSNNVLNNNLYWNTSGVTPTIRINEKITVDWDTYPAYFESDGVESDPEFNSSDDFTLEYVSKAKNKGACLIDLGVTKDKFGNPRPYWNNDFDIGAFEIEDTQFKIGAVGLLGNPTIIHSLKAYDTYWERTSTPSWIISTDQYIDSTAFTTIGNTPSDIDSLYGWEYKWLDRSGDDQNTSIGAGFYEVSNNYNSNARFYIDLRDAVQDYSLNVGIRYNGDLKQYQYYKNGSWENYIPNGAVLRIWDINGGYTHTNVLTDYWNHALLLIPKLIDEIKVPRLIWGPYDAFTPNGYKVHRSINTTGGPPLTYGNLASLSDSVYEYIDEGLAAFGGSWRVYYKILAYNSTDSLFSNVADTSAAGFYKKSNTYIANIYSLDQNYPNPFNPSTKILFSLGKEEHVTLKIYDILGREVKTLISQVMIPGNHEVLFNGEYFASGIYIYRLTSGSFSAVKKMQILK